MKVGVIGSGAVGLYYGARLQRAGVDVQFLLRSDFEAISDKGVRVRASDGNFHLERVRAVRSVAEMGEVDLAIVALKATSNESLKLLLDPVVGAQTAILCLQNGLGADERLQALYPQSPILGGLCFVCLNRVAPGVVENYHLGSIAIGERGGPASRRTKEIGQLFARAGVTCRVSDDLRGMQWRKLVWNIPFNGLSVAAGGVTTDVIVSDEGLCGLAKGLMQEIVSAARAIGLDLSDDIVEENIELTRRMGEYAPSSLIDHRAGRPVEVDAIWGEPLRQGLQAGAEMPRLEALFRLLRLGCETGRGR